MIIIIEGPDGAGKSTLAKAMSEKYHAPIIHRTKPKSEEEKAMLLKMYKEVVADKSANIIFDRCWYSEYVYGKIFNDELVISWLDIMELEKTISKTHGFGCIFYCTSTTEDLWQRCGSRGESYVTDRTKFEQVCESYRDVFIEYHHELPVFVIFDVNQAIEALTRIESF